LLIFCILSIFTEKQSNKMKYLLGKDRNQITIFPVTIDQSISNDNEVRLIDLFVDSLPIKDYGFKVDFIENGRPAYHPADLLKLYLYGYLNKVRSSRDLEKECSRNIELMWLLKGLTPDHNTISNFRRDNGNGIREVFKATVKTAKHFNLIGKKLIAGDSTKLRAQNSKKNNYNQEKISRHLEYIDNKLNEYTKLLSTEDGDQKKDTIKKEIDKHKKRKEKYHQLEQQLIETGQDQISTSDSESRQMITRNNITEVAYNVQTTVDAAHNLLIDYKVTNTNDSKAMGEMLGRASEILETTDFTALYDKGYHNGREIKAGQEMKVNLLVAIPDVASKAPDIRYNMANFRYDTKKDTYTCPENKALTSNGSWYNKKSGDRRAAIQVKHYITKACETCKARGLCTTNKKGRIIERSQYAENVEQNRKNIEANKTLYKQRQAIVEHPYGTIKRQWGFSYILTKKGMQRATSDVGLMFTAYNLKRITNIIGLNEFKKYLKVLVQQILQKLASIWTQNLQNMQRKKNRIIQFTIFDRFVKWLRFGQILQFNGGF
jgi:transposase